MHALAQAWLSLQCKMISGTSQGMVILGSELSGSLAPTASWPTGTRPDQALSAAASLAVSKGEGVTQVTTEQESSLSENDFIACPIIVNHDVLGVVAIATQHRSSARRQATLQMLKWGAVWLTFYLEKEKTAQKDKLIALVELISTSLNHADFHACSTAVVNELATKLTCHRVTLGIRKNNQTTIQSISATAHFDKRRQLVRELGRLMDEAIEQDQQLVFPAENAQSRSITLAHKDFHQTQGKNPLCTIPLPGEQGIFGAITFERQIGHKFDQDTLDLIIHIAQYIGPVLSLKHKNDRGLTTQLVDKTRKFAQTTLGKGHYKQKMIGLLLLLTVIFFSFTKADYRVTSPAVLEGTIQRSVVAPINGYLEAAHFSAGDSVIKGDLIASLSDKDLILEKIKLRNEKRQLEKEYRESLAQHDRAQLSIINARIKQADAQIKLLKEEIKRTKILSPFNGRITEGDLSHQLDSPIEKGQVLFEISPENSYRVILNVDEKDISEIVVGQTGALRLSSLPDQNIGITIEKITPVASTYEGINSFRVEASLDEVKLPLQPGMKGAAKTNIESRKLIWIWTHTFFDHIKLWLWQWKI